MFQKYAYLCFICRFFALKYLFGIRYSKRIKTLKIGLKNAFSELAECGKSPHRKPNDVYSVTIHRQKHVPSSRGS